MFGRLACRAGWAARAGAAIIQTVTAAAKRATARADVRYRFICDCISTSYASDRNPSSASCRISIVSKNASILNFGGWYPQQVFTGFVPAPSVGVVGGREALRIPGWQSGHRHGKDRALPPSRKSPQSRHNATTRINKGFAGDSNDATTTFCCVLRTGREPASIKRCGVVASFDGGYYRETKKHQEGSEAEKRTWNVKRVNAGAWVRVRPTKRTPEAVTTIAQAIASRALRR